MTLVLMTSTVNELTSGGTYRVRAKYAEQLVKAGQASKATGKKISGPGNSKEGKR